jgi:phosphate uptake regulator
MIKALIESWKAHGTQGELYHSFVEMLEMNWAVFEIVMEVLAGRVGAGEVEDDVLVRDIAINRKERSIRRRLVEHLAMKTGDAVPSGLVLMSVVKDAERLGDYCKNLLEVEQMLEKPACELRFSQDVVDLGAQVTQNFRGTLRAFTEADAVVAREILEDETLMNQRCDRLVSKLARSDLPAHEAVPTALWIRFLKRINAHLANICSSLVLPVHRIDYRLHYEKEKSAVGRVEARKRGEEPPPNPKKAPL